MALTEESRQRVRDHLLDWRWRLNNLYFITDKAGRRVRFEMNWAQQALYDEMHYLNVILKARQLGFSTFIQIFMLDACVFNSNVRAGVIAHTLPDAQAIFRDKVKFPYDNLPDAIKAARSITRDSASELALSNNSAISVSTSHRGGTLQYLHVSELGKIAAKSPEKAREIRTGAFNTIQAGQVIFVESTAEGQEGDFHRICEEAQSAQRMGSKLTELDFKFFFFPWWKHPDYTIDPDGVVIPATFEEYFAKLEKSNGIVLKPGQKAWYVKKAGTQLSDMKREYPSTPKEAFEASVEGAYYGAWMEQLEFEGRICERIADPNAPVHTAWDIGRSDYTSIWFWQRFVNECRVVGFYQNCGEGFPHYAEKCMRLYHENGWSRKEAVDYVPHDARVVEWGSNKSRLEQMRDFYKTDLAKEVALELGMRPDAIIKFWPNIATELSLHDGINAVRALLPSCTFDATQCDEGIKMLKNYRKEWDDNLSKFKDMPRHDIYSHGSDAFRYLATAHRDVAPPPVEEKKPYFDPKPVTIGEMVKDMERRRRGSGSERRI
jgi:hypothetical protein